MGRGWAKDIYHSFLMNHPFFTQEHCPIAALQQARVPLDMCLKGFLPFQADSSNTLELPFAKIFLNWGYLTSNIKINKVPKPVGSRTHVPALTSPQPSSSLLFSYLLFVSPWDFLKWICFLCPFTLKPYASLVLLFLFPLAASANLVLKGTTSVLPWLLPPVYTRIFSWSADTGFLKCFISLPVRIM